ncbi:hypothetical protein DLM86_20380 [Paenibacillus flagellatus]|uniref:Cytochrome c biogenesis protein CcdC n=2 Tax=Paenibacillus flagellatus TaxID=2211139 RepID=A0A2V5K0J7_9BACL|nr:cytochrome c biogenesis protein CcdC [Paenibacillus flagellatus]PYI52709.1 hypothetical protein DLM86_20380 [Paenibacillus flagellatus]
MTHLASALVTLLFGATVIAVRLKAADRPTSLRKIIIPPIGMSTGFAMFLVPATHIPWLWALGAFVAGAVFFSYPLIRTSTFERRGEHVYLTRSKAFIVIIIALLAIRLLLHDLVEQAVTIPQTGALFFLLAFGMILPWRLAMARQYRSLTKKSEEAGN